MQNWIAIKGSFIAWSGLDSGALHTIASVLLLTAAAALLRKPLASWVPWTAVLAVEVANEAASAYADRLLEEWEIVAAVQDTVLVMVIPTILLLACRLSPWLAARPAVRIMPSYVRQPSGGTDIIDAQFEEIR